MKKISYKSNREWQTLDEMQVDYADFTKSVREKQSLAFVNTIFDWIKSTLRAKDNYEWDISTTDTYNYKKELHKLLYIEEDGVVSLKTITRWYRLIVDKGRCLFRSSTYATLKIQHLTGEDAQILIQNTNP